MSVRIGAGLPNGVMFSTGTHVVTAYRSRQNGTFVTCDMAPQVGQHTKSWRDKPFLRGIMLLLEFLRLLPFQVRLVVGLMFVVSSLSQYFGRADQTSPDQPWLGYLILLVAASVLRVWLQSTFRYHGAEHKVWNAWQKYGNLRRAREASRVSDGCGTNLAVAYFTIVWLLTSIPGMAWVPVLLTSGAAWVVAYEVLDLPRPLTWPFLFVGGLVQRFFVTAEPSVEELEVAQVAFSYAYALSEGATPEELGFKHDSVGLSRMATVPLYDYSKEVVPC